MDGYTMWRDAGDADTDGAREISPELLARKRAERKRVLERARAQAALDMFRARHAMRAARGARLSK